MGNRCVSVIRSTDLSCRFGGEEFVILLPETRAGLSEEIAERLRREIADMNIETSKGSVSVTVSLGITYLENASYADPRIALERMITQSDQALYASKFKGRNRITIWDENLTTSDLANPNNDSYEYFVLAETLHQREAELKWVETSRKVTEEHLASILQNASEAIISVNELSRILVFNRSAENMFGYNADDILGKHIKTIIPNGNNDLINWEKQLEHEHASGLNVSERNIYWIKCKDGKHLPVEASHSGFDINGQKIYTVILTDVTTRLQAEDQVRQNNIELSNAYDETIAGLAASLELRDIETLGHSRRVVDMTLELARVMGVDESEYEHLRRALCCMI